MTGPSDSVGGSSFDLAFLGIAHVHFSDHLAALEEDGRLRLTAIWDPDTELTGSVPSELVAADPETAAARADVVVIDSVTSAHVELVPVVARAGKPVFVEKPLGGLDIGGSAQLAWDDEVPATVDTSWVARPGGLHVVLKGTAATASIEDGTLTLVGSRRESWAGEQPDAKRALQAFIADLRGRPVWEAPSTSQAVRVAQLLDDAQRMATRSN